MIRLIIEIISGFASTIAGFYSAFLFLKSQEQGTNFLFLIPIVPLLFIGTKLLFKATAAIKYVEEVPDPLAHLGSPDGAGQLEKNQELLDDWRKTATNQAKLETLKMQDNMEKESAL